MAKPTPAKPSFPPPPGPVFASLSGRRLRRPDDGGPDYRKPTPWRRLAAGALFPPEGFLFRLIRSTAP
jgi:hypothetical protein